MRPSVLRNLLTTATRRSSKYTIARIEISFFVTNGKTPFFVKLFQFLQRVCIIFEGSLAMAVSVSLVNFIILLMIAPFTYHRL